MRRCMVGDVFYLRRVFLLLEGRLCGDAEMFQPVLGHVPPWCSTRNTDRSPRSFLRERIT